jgi:purine-binding chemotaxis protein CheW
MAKAATTPGPAAGASQEYVTFTVNDEDFAVRLSEVKEIIRLPPMVKAPLSPRGLAGLANLRGQVLPVVALRTVFGWAPCPPDDATRVVVFDLGRPVGLIVDRMRNVMSVDAARIEDSSSLQATIDTELLRGLIKTADGKSVFMILEVERLLEREFQGFGRAAAKAGDAAAAIRNERDAEPASARGGERGEAGEEAQLVSFVVAGQEYALPIEEVQEIVQQPERITAVPGGSAHVLGVMTLRDRILPLISLHALFGLPEPEADDNGKIVVVGLAGEGGASGLRIGLTTDSVREVLRVAGKEIEPTPPMLAQEQGMADVKSFCRLDAGKRLVSVLSARAMLDANEMHEVVRAAGEQAEMAETEPGRREEAALDDERQFVVFRLMDDEYGVLIQAVQEIVRVPENLTRVPKTPDFIEGVVNLRGSVLPVVDNRKRLGLPSLERNERQRIMVFAIDGVHTGFIVDAVSEVMRIPHRSIAPAPDLSEEQRKLFREIANLDGKGRMILLVEVNQLLSSVQLKAVKQLAA